MARFINDQAKVVWLWESGTYANPSGNGVWMGNIQSSEFTESENVIQTRFIGQGNRNVGVFDNGPRDVTGTITLYPQHWRHLGIAIGSVQFVNGTNGVNVISEVNGGQRFSAFTSGYFNPWTSFTIEESRTGAISNQNSVRTIQGCVINEYTLNINQGELITEELAIVAQSGSWFSGATTAVTAGSNRSYLWSDTVWSLPGGTTQESVKNFKFKISNNFEAPHYVNGSRVIQIPYPLNRDYTIDVTQDLDSVMVGSVWDTFFKGGSIFNATLDINSSSATAGSHRLFLVFSGCRMTECTQPVAVGGISEVSYTIVPGSVMGSAYDRFSYNPF